MIAFLLKEFLSFFKSSIPSGVSFINRHLLILDGHDNHVALETIEHAKDIGLDIFTLSFHTSHALQPLDVYYFKLFKTTFRMVKDLDVSINNHKKLNKITLAS